MMLVKVIKYVKNIPDTPYKGQLGEVDQTGELKPNQRYVVRFLDKRFGSGWFMGEELEATEPEGKPNE